MSRMIYDNWERLVEATLKREQYYELCRAHSRTPSNTSSLSSDFTLPSPASIAAVAVEPSLLPVRVSRDHLFQAADAQPTHQSQQHSTIGVRDKRKNGLLINNPNPNKAEPLPKRINRYRQFLNRYNLYTYTEEKVMASTMIEGQDKVLATAQSLGNTDDMLLVPSRHSILSSDENPAHSSARFDAAELIILNDVDSASFSDDFLAAVDEIIQLTEELNLSSAADAGDDIVDLAKNALQLAMTRLEDEFRLILIRNTVPLDPDRLHRSSLSSSAAANDRILREIADRMIRSGYEKECCQVYCSVRRDVLDECLLILSVEKLSIEEVQRIEWRSLDDKMKKWIQAVKVVVRGVLSSEKHLCEEIFAGSDLIKEICFPETWRGCVMQLLNFGEAVATGRRSAEKLFRILDMYDALAEVLPDLQAIFMDEDAGDMVCSEARGVLDGLGKAAIGTLVEFENAVQGEASKKPIQNGEIHPLARDVMNYAKLLVDYSNTLNSLLENLEVESGQPDRENNDNTEGDSMSLIARRLMALITSLESNIEEKSRLYKDNAMQYIFLMNNILYIVQKVKDSELRKLLGDNWIRKRRGLVRQYATQYLRASWSRALSCL